APAVLEVDRCPVVGIDETQVPQLATLVDVRNARRRQLEQRLGQRRDVPGGCDLPNHPARLVLDGGVTDDSSDEGVEPRLVLRIRVEPAGLLLRLAYSFQHVR